MDNELFPGVLIVVTTDFEAMFRFKNIELSITTLKEYLKHQDSSEFILGERTDQIFKSLASKVKVDN